MLWNDSQSWCFQDPSRLEGRVTLRQVNAGSVVAHQGDQVSVPGMLRNMAKKTSPFLNEELFFFIWLRPNIFLYNWILDLKIKLIPALSWSRGAWGSAGAFPLEFPVHLTCMLFDCWRKPQNSQRTHTAQGPKPGSQICGFLTARQQR